jgi:hypothetical protein
MSAEDVETFEMSDYVVVEDKELSPVDTKVKYRLPQSQEGIGNEVPTGRLPIMIRQEERPKRKQSLGAKASFVSPHSSDDNLSEYEVVEDPGWVFSPSGKHRPHDFSVTPETNYIAPVDEPKTSSPAIIDGSVLGDYCHWIAGARLTSTGMRQMYAGLYATTLDEAEAGIGGKGVDSSTTPSINHDTTRTSTPNSSYLPILMGSNPSTPSRSAGGEIGSTPSSGKLLSTVVKSIRVLEVVARPDVALRDIMTSCFKASKVALLRYV